MNRVNAAVSPSSFPAVAENLLPNQWIFGGRYLLIPGLRHGHASPASTYIAATALFDWLCFLQQRDRPILVRANTRKPLAGQVEKQILASLTARLLSRYLFIGHALWPSLSFLVSYTQPVLTGRGKISLTSRELLP